MFVIFFKKPQYVHSWGQRQEKVWYKPLSQNDFLTKMIKNMKQREVQSYFSLFFRLRGWCSMISLLKSVRSMCIYISVVAMLSCPSILCIARKLQPPSKRCVANECRKVCGLIVFLSPMFSARTLMMWKTIIREMLVPRLLMKTQSSNPFLMEM